MNGVGNVSAVVVVQQHPTDCPLRPAWTVVRRVPCPWPFGADLLLASLGVDPRASADRGGVA